MKWCNDRLTEPLSLWGRGREAMTYGLVPLADTRNGLCGEAVSHTAELVRGDFMTRPGKAPSYALRAPRIESGAGSSPQGEKGLLRRRLKNLGGIGWS
jgi:hypothetical protein